MQGPNIGPLADDLYGSLHQIYKKPEAITGDELNKLNRTVENPGRTVR
jgi:hypothetical protein